MNCPRCQTPNPSLARFCLNCGMALTRHCTSCGSDLLPGARFCMHCGHPVINATPIDDNRFARVTAAAPKVLVEKVRAAAKLAGEQRVVTILFVDVVGSTRLSEQLNVETWTGIMNGVLDQVIPVIYRYEGTIARLLGDSLMAFFGAPIAHEDDPARAVRAALDIRTLGLEYAEQLQESYGIQFALRACIHTGTVIINAVSEDLKFEYTAMGGAVNLTSRIKFAARPMTVVISGDTHRFVHPLFDCTVLDPVTVKGRNEPMSVYQVTGVLTQPGALRGIRGLESPMVGRDVELNTLIELCDAVQAGLSRSVILIGEPGLGKTRLISEWKAAADRLRHQVPALWVEGRSLSYGQGLAYNLLISLVRNLFRIPDTCDEPETRTIVAEHIEELFGEAWMEVYPYIGHLLSLDLDESARQLVNLSDPQALQTQYFQAVLRLMVALSGRQPLVIVLEDLHWADPSSVDLLIRLLPETTSVPMLVCLVTREERDTPGWRLINAVREVMGNRLSELILHPLSEADSRKMVANLLKIETLPERVRKTIFKKAEGNPFFVEEIIRMLIDRGAIIQENDGWVAGVNFDSVEIPDNLQSLLLARIDRLPEEAKLVLRVASVIGRQFPVRVLEKVLQERMK